MGNVSDKSCRENQNTHYVLSNFFFLENRASYEIMWKNNVERGKPQMTIWRTACFSNGARHIVFCGLRLQIHIHTHTHSGCVILIAFPLQQWFLERASILRFTYTVLFLNNLATSMQGNRYRELA